MGNLLLGTLNKNFTCFSLIFCLGLLLAGVITWPFAARLSSYYSDVGDYPVNGSILMYNQKAIKTAEIFQPKLYFQGYQFYPLPQTLAFNDHQIILSLLFSPLYWLTQNIPLAVNLTNLLTFGLTFAISFYIFNSLVKNFWASLIGAAVYTFNPNTLAHFPYHLNLMARFFLPPAFLFAYRLFKTPSLKSAFLLGLFFTLNALSEAYYLSFVSLLLFIFLVFLFLQKLWQKKLIYFIKLAKFSLAALIFFPLLLYFTLPYLQFSRQEGAIREVRQNVTFSARLIDWLAPPKDSLLYGNLGKRLEKIRDPNSFRGGSLYYEQTLFLNVLPILLFLFASQKLIFEKGEKFTFFWFLLIASFILTFGPYFLGWSGNDSAVKLPFYYLYQSLPFLQGTRVPSRFQFIFYVPFSFFVALGVLFLLERFKQITLLLTILLIIILIIENLQIKNYQDQSAILKLFQNQRLSTQLKFLRGKPTIHLPVNLPDYGKESAYLNWAVNTQEILMNGNSSYLPSDHSYLMLSFKDKMDNLALQKLSALGIAYLIIHKNLISGDFWQNQPQLLAFSNLNKVWEDSNILIIDLTKLKGSYRICDFSKDLIVTVGKGSFENNTKVFNVAVIKNQHDCFFPSIGEERYKSINIETGSVQQTAEFRLPPMIGPFEQAIFSESTHDLKIKE